MKNLRHVLKASFLIEVNADAIFEEDICHNYEPLESVNIKKQLRVILKSLLSA